MDRSFSGRTAVITGASSGIGRALARALAARGCRVGLIARRRDVLETLAEEVRGGGGVAAAEAADVGDRAQVRAAVAALAEALGPADLLVANAGVGYPTEVDPVNIEKVEETFRVNLMGVVYAVEAALPAMLARGRGQVAAVSSLAAYRGLPGEAAYCASKAAVNVYLEALRVQLRGRGVDVTTVCPGYVRTPMTEPNGGWMPGLIGADDAAARIAGALRRRAKVYNFPWTTTRLAKLARWAPDWLLARMFHGFAGDPHGVAAAPASPSRADRP